jgi:two-component system NtrC family sensor kinase
MLRRSLTTKVLVAVGLTVTAVIGIYTYFVIRVQSTWWRERTVSHVLITSGLVHEYLNGVMLSDRHEQAQNFLTNLRDTDQILRGRITSTDGTVFFSTDSQEVARTQMTLPVELFREGRILHGERRTESGNIAIAMRPVENLPSCRRCHEQEKYIGAIVLEESLAPAEARIASSRNLLIAYGAIISILVGLVLWLLIVRLVRQPVVDLLAKINRVRSGDLTARADTRSRDEIGELAAGFNNMVESLATTKRQLEESHAQQIQQAHKLASIGELSASIAHEIRNPLAGIGAAVEVIADSADHKNGNGEIVAEIRSQIKRLNQTLHGLLDFARTREPEIVPCALADVIRPMLNLVRPDAVKQHIRITENIEPDLPAVCADAPQIQQAILNILLNAIQAMPDGGELAVSAKANKRADGSGVVQIIVTDTGTGIPDEIIQKIFAPFYTTKHRGTGLGLAITRAIIEKHNGAIIVRSQPGQGTTFIIELAACQPEVTSHAQN